MTAAIPTSGEFRRRRALVLALAVAASSCATLGTRSDAAMPGRTIRETLSRSIQVLERYDCERFAVDFLSPIRREQIADLVGYRASRACSATDRGNLDDVLLALRLALGATPRLEGVRAVIDLSGIGTRIQKLELVRYIDGRWYFNGF